MAEKEKMYKVKIDREPGENKNATAFVSVNERTFSIKKGVWVEVPECVKNELEIAEHAMQAMEEYEEKVQTK